MSKLQAHAIFPAALAVFAIAASAPSLEAQQATAADSTRTDSALVQDSSRAQKLESIRIRAARSGYASEYSRSALRMPAAPRDVPQSLTTVTRALVRDQAMSGMADVVRYIPGIAMSQGEGNRDQPTIRGNATTADFFVDGMRDDAQYFRDLYNLERVEALKGSNAMVFGRGGGGGVLNRVTKEAAGITSREVSAQAGRFGRGRVTADIQQKVSAFAGARLNTVYESSESFRDDVTLDRSGVNPTIALSTPSGATRFGAGYEYFRDRRTADRGIPSLRGRPLETAPSTFFGNPDRSLSRADVNAANATISHAAKSFDIRNRTSFADYDKFYQNVYPSGATDSTATLSAYNQSVGRRNFFNQTDLLFNRATGAVSHNVLVGAELGAQATSSYRNTGYFAQNATTTKVDIANPAYHGAVTFRQSATDADTKTDVGTRSVYIQDQVVFSPRIRLIAGARYESFGLTFKDKRTGVERRRNDGMLSPRAGFVVKPTELASIYANYSVSYLPGSGDQFTSLTDITKSLRPERFTNYEVGAKWDALNRIALTFATYRLDRTNTRSIDPSDPARVIQTGAQRSEGIELGATGNITQSWQIAAGAAAQRAKIISATAASAAGAKVPLVPSRSVSLWNKYSLSPRLGIAAGMVHQSKIFAAIDNTVTLPAFTRFDGALYLGVTSAIRAQLNVENLFDVRYYPSSFGNNNIGPGSPRDVRLTLSAVF